MTRADVLEEARRWIGTPYRHQASCKGAGCDCLGLVRGVWRACIGPEPETVPPYAPDWSEGGENLLEAARRRLVPMAAPAPGDVLLFRPHARGPARHCAILSSAETMIHAYWGRAVAETPLTRWWRRRIAGTFAFPGLEA